MDDAFTVDNDAMFTSIRRDRRRAGRAKPAPSDFDNVAAVDTGGTLFPGLIELHNHLSYNVLPLWSPVPKLFSTAVNGPTTATTASSSAVQ